MSEDVIKIENVSKKYVIGAKASWNSLGDEIIHMLRTPFMWGSKNDDGRDPFWALKDINLHIKNGEVIGIIGRNGAGKTTLLKILSKITAPTSGRVLMKGRVASLLEIGTGFHPELTGRENIYLNGALLGMNKREIREKFDQIVDFSEVGRFLDTPVKRYSSGMYVRLAFAVAAYLEPEILIVDEVLAVGDVQFQKKCLGKMGDVAKGGRTVIFVSHNMGSIQKLCTSAVLLNNGVIEKSGNVSETVKSYLETAYENESISSNALAGPLSKSITFEKLKVNGIVENAVISPSEPVVIEVEVTCDPLPRDFMTSIAVFKDEVRLFTLHDVLQPEKLEKGYFSVKVEVPSFFLRPGEYSLGLGGETSNGRYEWLWGTNLYSFIITEEWNGEYNQFNKGMVNLCTRGSRTFL